MVSSDAGVSPQSTWRAISRRMVQRYQPDAVKFQRKIREELSKNYNSDRDAFLCELREKYGNLRKQKVGKPTR